MSSILQLFPTPQAVHALEGLYLGHDLRSIERDDRPFVYSNFIASLDGRVAVPDESGELVLPAAIKNDRDWRLFQELAVQADLVITSGRYLRDYEAGKAQEILMVYDDPHFADLGKWRVERGLPPYPDLAVISRSGDFPIPEPLRSGDRRIYAVTTGEAGPDRLQSLERQAEVIVAGETSVDAGSMVSGLFERGYRLMYNATGSQVMHLLVSAGVLDRLYLTQPARILGGDPFASLVEGSLLEPALDFNLHALYYDPAALDGLGQLFFVYDRFSLIEPSRRIGPPQKRSSK